MAGAVYLNGKRVQIASKPIRNHANIQVMVDLKKLNADGTRQDLPFLMTEERIVYEDVDLIVFNKPPGLPTQPTLDESRNNLYAAAKKFLAQRNRNTVDQNYLGLHHRLDRDTSGLVLMTKSKEANPGIAAAFKNHGIRKVYQAIVLAQDVLPSASWEVKNYLGRARSSGKKNVYCSVRSGGDFAHTEFHLLEDMGAGYFVEARPLTGRTHQIRVHLSEGALPILGDQTYASQASSRLSQELQVPRLMLHAVSLTFTHPILQTEVSVHCQVPEDFNQCLKRLHQRHRDFGRRPPT